MTTTLRAFCVLAAMAFVSLAPAGQRAQDEKPPSTPPCASMGIVVYPGMGPQDLKAIQDVMDKFMARVRAKCVTQEDGA